MDELAENYVGNKGNKEAIYCLFFVWNCDGNAKAMEHLNTRGAMSDIYQVLGHPHLAPLPKKLNISN